jgi:hypothetical protein
VGSLCKKTTPDESGSSAEGGSDADLLKPL